MTDNRSLDEFAGGEGEDDRPVDDGTAAESVAEASETVPDSDSGGDDASDARTPDAGEATEADGDAAEADPEEAVVEPVASTYAWSPDGGECAACGEAVEERWRDGDDLVCLDCKEW